HLWRAEKPSVKARSVQSLVAEDAGPIRVGEWHHHQVTLLQLAYVGSHRLHDADRFVTHGFPALARLHQVIGPEIAAADAGAADGEEGIGRFDDAGIGDGLDPD